jgi:hypothetical protein
MVSIILNEELNKTDISKEVARKTHKDTDNFVTVGDELSKTT